MKHSAIRYNPSDRKGLVIDGLKRAPEESMIIHMLQPSIEGGGPRSPRLAGCKTSVLRVQYRERKDSYCANQWRPRSGKPGVKIKVG